MTRSRLVFRGTMRPMARIGNRFLRLAVICQIGRFLAKVRDSRWLKQNCHERVRVANSKILFNQWRNEHPSRYRLGHNLTFTNFGQEPTIVAKHTTPSNGFPRGTRPRSARRCSMTRRREPIGSAPCNEATPVTTTDGTLPRSDRAGGGFGVADGQGLHVCEPWFSACTHPAWVPAGPLIRKSGFMAQ